MNVWMRTYTGGACSMASQGQITRDVERAVEGKGSVRGRNPISMLCNMVDAKSSQGKEQVKTAVERLEADGRLRVDREKGLIVAISTRETPVVTERWRPETSEGRRQSRFAKGVPSTLPDDMCGPVIVTKITPPSEESTPTEQEVPEMGVSQDEDLPYRTVISFIYDEDEPYYEVLTMCLTALRHFADESGHSREGVSNVLRLIDGMTEGRVQRAMTYLRKMNLYAIKRVAYQKTEYFVDMKVERITREMVQQVDRKHQSPSQPDLAKDEVTADDGQGAVEPDPLTRLAEIIESLEASKATLETELASMRRTLEERTRERDEALSERRRLRDDKTRLLRELDELRERVTPKVTGKVADILSRYQ